MKKIQNNEVVIDSQSEKLIMQNEKDIFQILNAVRSNNIHDPGATAILLKKVSHFFLRNTSNNNRLSCSKCSYTRFRLRFFDFVGRIWERDSWEGEVTNSFTAQFESDEGLGSWFDPRRKQNADQTMPSNPSEQVLCLILNYCRDSTQLPIFPRKENIITFPHDVTHSLSMNLKTFENKLATNGRILVQWKDYLSKVLLLRNIEPEMDAKMMAFIFFESLSQNFLDWKSLNNSDHLRSSYAYIFPCIISNEVACLLTIRTNKFLATDDCVHIDKVVLPALSNLALLLSARVVKSFARESHQDLTRTYLKTQSNTIWAVVSEGTATRSEWHKLGLVNEVFGSPSSTEGCLSTLKQQLSDNLCIPIGDRQIAILIREHFLNKALDTILSGDLKTSRERLKKLLIAALDDENALRGIPSYRQHFIHSFHVFLTGLRILIERPNDETDEPIIHVAKEMRVDARDVLKAWFCAAIFHDVSYSVANVEEWVGFFLDRVILKQTDRKVEELGEQWVLNQIARLFRFENYQDSFTQLIATMASFSHISNQQKLSELSNKVYTMLLGRDCKKIPVKSDHGILSALMFLNVFDRKHLKIDQKDPFENKSGDLFIRLAADAIAHHCEPMSIPSSSNKGSSRNPLRDLLIISDEIQQWGRTESDESLALFDIQLVKWEWKKNRKHNVLEVALKFKKPIEYDRCDSKKAKDFICKRWPKVRSKIYEYTKRFFVPHSTLVFTVECDAQYVGRKRSVLKKFVFKSGNNRAI